MAKAGLCTNYCYITSQASFCPNGVNRARLKLLMVKSLIADAYAALRWSRRKAGACTTSQELDEEGSVTLEISSAPFPLPVAKSSRLGVAAPAHRSPPFFTHTCIDEHFFDPVVFSSSSR